MSDLLRNLFGGSEHRDSSSHFNVFDQEDIGSNDAFESHHSHNHHTSSKNTNGNGPKCPNGEFICNFSLKGGGGPCVKNPLDCPCPNPKYKKCNIGNNKFICLNPSQDCARFQ